MGFSRAGAAPEPAPEQPGDGWDAVTLRGACLTLVRSAPGAISRISVSGPRPALPDAERWLRGLAARLADEYGLQAEVEARDPGISVVFARAVGKA